MTDSELKQVVETALHGESRLRGRDIDVAVEGGMVVLKGQLPELSEKRLAVNLVRRMRDVGDVKDQLRLFTTHEMTDKQIQQHILDGWLEDGALHKRRLNADVVNGVATLSGKLDSCEEKCFAGLIAWWVPGVTDVDNQIVVEPEQDMNDGDLLDVIRAAFSKDVLVTADSIGVTAQNGVVTLLGSVGSEEERLAAEHDAYYILGVTEVINQLQVSPR
jgi:osmotically-inducible protein OsmY